MTTKIARKYNKTVIWKRPNRCAIQGAIAVFNAEAWIVYRYFKTYPFIKTTCDKLKRKDIFRHRYLSVRNWLDANVSRAPTIHDYSKATPAQRYNYTARTFHELHCLGTKCKYRTNWKCVFLFVLVCHCGSIELVIMNRFIVLNCFISSFVRSSTPSQSINNANYTWTWLKLNFKRNVK